MAVDTFKYSKILKIYPTGTHLKRYSKTNYRQKSCNFFTLLPVNKIIQKQEIETKTVGIKM